MAIRNALFFYIADIQFLFSKSNKAVKHFENVITKIKDKLFITSCGHFVYPIHQDLILFKLIKLETEMTATELAD